MASTTGMLVDLRLGSTADLPTVDRIMRAAFDPRFGEAWTRGQCLGIMAMPGVWLRLATVEGRCVGFAMARAIVDDAELLLLATDPEARRNGVGRALVQAIIDDARDRGAAQIHLEVRAGNDAVGLYARAGFAKVGERRGYYRGINGQTFDALTYSRRID